MKRFLALLLALTLLCTLAACGEKETPSESVSESETSSESETVSEPETESEESSEPEESSEESALPEEETLPEEEPEVREMAGNPTDFDCMTLPSEAVKTLDELGVSLEDYLKNAVNMHNDAMEYISTVVSPYYTLTVNGNPVPVYGTLAYADSVGVLHSFSTVYVKNADETPLEVELTCISGDFSVKSCTVLPLHAGAEASCSDGRVTVTLQGTGSYSFLVNDPDQAHAFVLQVKENCDDEAEIAALEETYGRRLVVYEPGVYYEDTIQLLTGGAVYFCKNSLVIANPRNGDNFDSFITLNNNNDVLLTGYGVLEMSLLGHSDRVTMTAYGCKRLTVRDITVINNAAWNLYFYTCSDCTVDGVTILAHRTNSDGINICNSKQMTVQNCYVRCGDDCYSAKTLGGNDTATAENILFRNCTAWAGKARCFGITGEAEKNITGVTFRDCDVVVHDATWDNSRIAALAIVIENNPSNTLQMTGVTFENIELYRAVGRPMNVTVLNADLTGLTLSEIVFRNVTCGEAGLNSRVWAENDTNVLFVAFENVLVGGESLTEALLDTDAGAKVEIR